MTTVKIHDSVTDAHIALAEKRIDTKLRHLRELGARQDAIAFSRGQLETMEQTIYDVLYTNPNDAFTLLPLKTDVPDGSTDYSYRMLSKLGEANWVADGSSDRNLVDVDLTKYTRDIFEMGSGYTFTVGDQARGGVLDFEYVQEKARLAAERIAAKHSDFALNGKSDSSVTGFLNDGNVTIMNAGELTDNDWTTVTGADAYATISDMLRQVLVTTKQNADTVALSTFVYSTLSTRLLDSTGGTKTILAALRENNPSVNFIHSASCDGAGAGGVDRCVAYQRRSDRVEYVASVVYDESVPVSSGFRFTVQSRGRAAGTVVRLPGAMVYGDITVA